MTIGYDLSSSLFELFNIMSVEDIEDELNFFIKTEYNNRFN